MPKISQSMKIPENFTATGKDGACLSVWDKVEGAEGYKLQFFRAEDPDKCIKTRYAQDCRKMILGFENGKNYLVRVCAFKYENNTEFRGSFTEKQSFVPISVKLKAQGTICLKVGGTEQIVCECNNKTPNVKYLAETPDIASVSVSGVVTAKKSGTGFVRITASDGQVFRTKIVVERDLTSGRGSAVLMLTGDLMCAVAHQRAAQSYSYDFNSAFDGVRDIFTKADYVVGVLETSCYDSKPFEHEQLRHKKGAPNCNSPSMFISACANAGFDGLVTANNHNCDTGKEGLEFTVAQIKRHGMENFGTLGDNPVVVNVKGIKVGIVACSMISNGLEGDFGGDMLSVVNIIGRYDNDYFTELVNRARAMGAEYVIAYQHWGKMNSVNLTKTQVETAKFMAASGVDLIVGSHPHTVQKFTYIKTEDGKRIPCAYSLGNFITSMKEMRENRDSAVLRVELSRENGEFNGKVKAKLSYMPFLNENTEQGVAAMPAFPPHSKESEASFLRTKAVMGTLINHFVYRPTVMLSGSAVLNDIFVEGRGFRFDRTAVYLSQISLGSQKGFDPPEGCDEKLELEFTKDLAGYIKKTLPDFLAVDFYTAASVSCHRFENVKSAEPCYFTNIRRFRKSAFFEEHASEKVRVRPPFGEDIWKPLIKRYSEIVKSTLPHERVILFRCSISGNRFLGTELRKSGVPERRNRLMRAMEDMFISIVNPVVIDLSQYYLTLAENTETVRFEDEYYKDAYNAACEAAKLKGISYISAPDIELWFDRVMKFYDNMTARAYQSWIMDMKSAADKIIARTSKVFAARHRERLIRLKKSGSTDLSMLRDLFINDKGAEEIIRAGEIIDALERGNISKSYDFYAPAFNGHFNIIKTMVRLLSAETGVSVNENSAEIVFLLRGKPQFKRYIASLNRMTIDIWGSCVSRESINRCKDAFVGKYIFKQAPILAYEPPIEIEFPEGTEAFCGNSWRKRTMHDSFSRNGFEILAQSGAQWVMVDFYDLICTMEDYKGQLFEVDDFIRRTDFYKSIKDDCKQCYLFEKRDMKYCFEAVTRFANEIRERYDNRIILIKTDPKEKYITLDYHLADLEDEGMFNIKQKFISLCEERFASITGCYVIDISKHFYSSDNFPLGGAHIVHYEEEFYRQTAEYISDILNGSEQKTFSTVDDNYLLLRSLKLNRDK